MKTLDDAKKQAWAGLEPVVMECWTAVGERPSLWWELASPQPRDKCIPQVQQLHAMDELSEDELAALEAAAEMANIGLHESLPGNYSPFRRSWSFWTFISPEPRDTSISELEQLQRLGALTPAEQLIAENPIAAQNAGMGYRSDHLTAAECRLMRLPEPAER